MADPYFFGYGSLVNRATHGYAQAHRAQVTGWRRAWRYTIHRSGPFLTAVPCAASTIEGLVAKVPGADWAALDLREAGYARVALEAGLRVDGPADLPTQIYAVPADDAVEPDWKQPILLSYVDVVFQGYLREYGEDGVHRFIATTDGWEAPILNDRAQPRYPRHQPLTPEELRFFDALLTGLDARLVQTAP